MSMVPLGGVIGSAAGAPRSQTAGEVDRTQKDAQAHGRQVATDQLAENASGIGQTEQDQESSERDADGRRPWELPVKRGKAANNDLSSEAPSSRQSKDASGQSGNQLDLTG